MKAQAIRYLNSLITDYTTKKDIDLIEFVKKCVKEYEVEEKQPKVDWNKYFEILWKLYPRKVSKQQAKKNFEKVIRGLNEEECKEKCNLIYKAQMIQQQRWKTQKTEICYIPHYGTWLLANIPTGKHYKGK